MEETLSVTPTEPIPQAPTTPPAEPVTPSDSGDKPLGEGGEKALKAEREARANAEKSAAALQKQLDEINAANLSDLEKAQKAAKDAEEVAAKATVEALRYRVAAKHGISTKPGENGEPSDADLFLTSSDPDVVEKQAVALAARTSTAPRPDLSQGGKPPTGSSPESDFESFIKGQLS